MLGAGETACHTAKDIRDLRAEQRQNDDDDDGDGVPEVYVRSQADFAGNYVREAFKAIQLVPSPSEAEVTRLPDDSFGSLFSLSPSPTAPRGSNSSPSTLR